MPCLLGSFESRQGMSMLINFPRFIRDLATLKGIPEEHLSAVVHRFIAARKARDQLGGFTPTSPMHEITQVETQIEHMDRLLAKRIVEGAAEDYRNGFLERRILLRGRLYDDWCRRGKKAANGSVESKPSPRLHQASL